MDEEAPSEEELNEADDSRAAAKGVDDNGSTEVVALEKANLIVLMTQSNLQKLMILLRLLLNLQILWY